MEEKAKERTLLDVRNDALEAVARVSRIGSQHFHPTGADCEELRTLILDAIPDRYLSAPAKGAKGFEPEAEIPDATPEEREAEIILHRTRDWKAINERSARWGDRFTPHGSEERNMAALVATMNRHIEAVKEARWWCAYKDDPILSDRV